MTQSNSGEHIYQEATQKLLQLLNRINHPQINSLTHTPTHLSILKSIIKKYPIFISEIEPALLHDTYSDLRFIEKLWIIIERNSEYFFPLRVKEFLQGEKFTLKRIEIFIKIEQILKKLDQERSKERFGVIKQSHKNKQVRKESSIERPSSSYSKNVSLKSSSRLKDHFEGHQQDKEYQLSKDVYKHVEDELSKMSQSQLNKINATNGKALRTEESLQKIEIQRNPQRSKSQSSVSFSNQSQSQTQSQPRSQTQSHIYDESQNESFKNSPFNNLYSDEIQRLETENVEIDKALQNLDIYTKKLESLEKEMDKKFHHIDRKFKNLDKFLDHDRSDIIEKDFESMMFGQEKNEKLYNKFDKMIEQDEENRKRFSSPEQSAEKETVQYSPSKSKKYPQSGHISTPKSKAVIVDDEEVNNFITNIRKNLEETNAFITYCQENSLRHPRHNKIEQ